MRLLSTEASTRATGRVTPASGRFDPFDASYLRAVNPKLAP